MKVGDLVKHRAVDLGPGLVVKVKQHWVSCDIVASVLWVKHSEVILEVPEGLELISESR